MNRLHLAPLSLLLTLTALACSEVDDNEEDNTDDCPDDVWDCGEEDEEEDEGITTWDDEDSPCGDRDLGDAESTVFQLVELGYTNFDDSDFSEEPSVITDAEAWAETVERWGNDGGLRPDFSLDVVFVFPWNFDGCNDDPVYSAWRFDDAVRLDVDFEGSDCDMAMPMLDYIVVQHQEIEDAGYCP
jgi:hypothetical protein